MGPSEEGLPEIEHLTIGYEPLHKLIKRLVQDSWNDLNAVIDDMAVMPAQQAPNKGGAHGLTNGDTVMPANVQKKKGLIEFAQKRRAQYIKILVLARWSREAKNVGRVIDLRIWLDRQRAFYDDAGFWLGDLRRSLAPAKVPNPDIKTALEVLSSSKAPWLSDLGYLPLDPLTPKELLNKMRTINTLLTIRLNLHEDIPYHFSDYTIRNGRATFRVPNEFEADLTIGDEDSSTQLFFIDFRFDFAPMSLEIPLVSLRNDLEFHANAVLLHEGLQGCYDFLHDFVLTHKIGILRKQAIEMSRSQWTGSIRLENVRRSLVVQYWVPKQGSKSWIEIGINSGRKAHRATYRKLSTPMIGVRWVRDGKEVESSPVDLSLHDLSMERILKRFIALHTTYILSSIRDRLSKFPIYEQQRLSLSLQSSQLEPSDIYLTVQLTESTIATLSMEPTSGRMYFRPPLPLYSRVENDLGHSKEPHADGHLRLGFLRCIVASEEAESTAKGLGWDILRNIGLRQEDAKRIFPTGTQRIVYFQPRGWAEPWMIAFAVGTSTTSWTMLQVSFDTNEPSVLVHQRLDNVMSNLKTLSPTYERFSQLEQKSAEMISLFLTQKTLLEHGARASANYPSSQRHGSKSSPTLRVDLCSFLHHTARSTSPPLWLNEALTLTFQGIILDEGKAGMLCEAQITDRGAPLDLVKDHFKDDIAFSPSTGAFVLSLRAPVGVNIVRVLRARIQRIQRVIGFLNVIKKRSLSYSDVSLLALNFTYSKNPECSAELHLHDDVTSSLTLPRTSPHHRILNYLETALSQPVSGFELCCNILDFTLPLLLSLNTIEQRVSESSPTTPYIISRSVERYQVRYDNPICRFEIRLRLRRDVRRWHVSEDNTRIPENRDSKFAEALANLWNENGDSFIGLRTGISATLEGVKEVVERLDGIVRQFWQDGSSSVELTHADGAGNTPALAKEGVVEID